MFGKIAIIGALCVLCVSSEAPFNSRYRFQRFRQQPTFQRQEAAPYPAAGLQPEVPFNLPSEGNIDPAYGPPPPATPGPAYGAPPVPTNQYGAPPRSNDEGELTSNEALDNPDSETIANPAAPSRFTKFEKLRQAPRNNGRNQQKFQRLELQEQQQQQLQPQQLPALQPLPSQSLVPLQPQAQLFQRLEVAPIQQAGSYFIQLPNGSIQRVTYLAQPSVVDNSVSARLQFRPIAEAQATSTVADPQIYVNTLVQAYTNTNQN